MDQFIDWVYSQLVGFFGNFFAEMGNMGVELFEMSWVQSIVLFFSYLAWTLYVVGLVVAVFEVGIEYQTGRASIKDAAISAVKGFMAVGCFTLVPVELYKLSVTLQASLTSGITGYGESFDALSTDIINSLQGVDIGAAASSGVFGGIGSITSTPFSQTRCLSQYLLHRERRCKSVFLCSFRRPHCLYHGAGGVDR